MLEGIVGQLYPVVLIARLVAMELDYQRTRRQSDHQGRAGSNCRIGNAGSVCSRAESDPLLHNTLPYDAPQHLRIRSGMPQLCGSVRETAPLKWRDV